MLRERPSWPGTLRRSRPPSSLVGTSLAGDWVSILIEREASREKEKGEPDPQTHVERVLYMWSSIADIGLTDLHREGPVFGRLFLFLHQGGAVCYVYAFRGLRTNPYVCADTLFLYTGVYVSCIYMPSRMQTCVCAGRGFACGGADLVLKRRSPLCVYPGTSMCICRHLPVYVAVHINRSGNAWKRSLRPVSDSTISSSV